jgi:hypothetical protein
MRSQSLDRTDAVILDVVALEDVTAHGTFKTGARPHFASELVGSALAYAPQPYAVLRVRAVHGATI